MLDQITPVILTYNEAPNIGRCLERLIWAKEVLVVDSFSTDETLSIAKGFANTRLVQRQFDSFAGQLNHAIADNGLATEWLLRLDSDYILSDALVEEFTQLSPADGIAGYRIAFTYCINGQALRGSLYPSDVILYRRANVAYVDDGHCERISVSGDVLSLRGCVFHDDRKPVGRWLAGQKRYMAQERDKLLAAAMGSLDWPDRIRCWGWLAPILVFFHCLFVKRLILDGWPGLFYTLQRTTAEFILALYLLEQRLKERKS